MEVITESERLTELRKTNLALILSNHPFDCPHCEKTGDCQLQDIVYEYGADQGSFDRGDAKLISSVLTGQKWDLPQRDDNPFITYEPNKCIVCGRCTLICNHVVMAGTIEMTGKGFDTKPDTAFGKPRSLENCEFCGQCVSTCPTAALSDRQGRGKGRKYQMKQVKTTCTYCGTGCNFFLNVKNNKVVKVTSRRGEIKVKAKITDRSRPGNVFLAFHHRNALSNLLTSGFRDPITGTPEYKSCAVRIEKL